MLGSASKLGPEVLINNNNNNNNDIRTKYEYYCYYYFKPKNPLIAIIIIIIPTPSAGPWGGFAFHWPSRPMGAGEQKPGTPSLV